MILKRQVQGMVSKIEIEFFCCLKAGNRLLRHVWIEKRSESFPSCESTFKLTRNLNSTDGGRSAALELDSGKWSNASEAEVKSGSNTESDGEFQQTSLVLRTKSVNRFDPVDAILDRIDTELGSLDSYDHRKGTKKNGYKNGRSGILLTRNNFEITDKKKANSEKDTDTGLGTGSNHDELFTLGDNLNQISGNAEMYSEGVLTDDLLSGQDNKMEQPSDLDSTAAQQVDAKFKEIMRRKKGGYLDDLRARIRKGKVDISRQSERRPHRRCHSYDETDDSDEREDSVRTEEIANEFNKCVFVNKPTLEASPVYNTLPPRPASTERQLGNRTTSTRIRQPPPRRLAGNSSDIDSVKTEDFEKRFNDLMVKQVAGVPVTKFEANAVDSDLDASSQIIKLKVNDVLKKSRKKVNEPRSPREAVKLYRSQSDRSKTSPRLISQYRENGSDSDDTLKGLQSGGTRQISNHSKISNHDERGEDSLDDQRREISRESARIRGEIKSERRTKSLSPRRPVLNTSQHRSSTEMPTSVRSLQLETNPSMEGYRSTHLNGFSNSLKTPQEDKQILLREMKSLRQEVQKKRDELRSIENEILEKGEEAETVRSQIMMTEYKRENANTELTRITDELNRKRKQIQNFDDQVQSKLEEIRNFESLGLTKEEVMTILNENKSLKSRMRSSDQLTLERDELVRQLELAKESLFAEQKHFRTQKEEMKEEIENLMSKLEVVQVDWKEAEKTVKKLENTNRRIEKDKKEILEEKNNYIEDLKERNRIIRSEFRNKSNMEAEELRHEINDMRSNAMSMQEEVNKKDTEILSLKDNIIDLNQKLAKESALLDDVTQDHKISLQQLRKETDTAMVQLRESCFLEKQLAIEQLRTELEQEKKEALYRVEERLNHLRNEQTAAISSKNEEIVQLQSVLRCQEEEKRQLEKQVQEEVPEKIRAAVNQERQLQHSEHEWAIKKEIENAVAEQKRHLNQLSIELQKERQTRETVQKQNSELMKELEDQKVQNRQSIKERLAAVSRAKQMVREQTEMDVEKAKDHLRYDNRVETDKLRDAIRAQEAEIKQMRIELQNCNRQGRESTLAVDRVERTVISELNDECRRTSDLLGITPRTVQLSHFRSNNSAYGKKSESTKTPITSALANLRGCNEEMRLHVQELKQEVESLKISLSRLEREKDESIDKLKRQMERNKTFEMDRLKERLIKQYTTQPTRRTDHVDEMNKLNKQCLNNNNLMDVLREKDRELVDIQQSLNHWKEETADKFARKFEEQFRTEIQNIHDKHLREQYDMKLVNDKQQSEIDRLEKEIQLLSRGKNRTFSDSSPNNDTLNFMCSLHGRQKDPQYDKNNINSMRWTKYSSTPDLTNTDLYSSRSRSPTREHDAAVRSFEERLKQGERADNFLENSERANRAILSQKMADLNKVQNTLSNQTVELMQLGRAYNHLGNRSSSPVRSTLVR